MGLTSKAGVNRCDASGGLALGGNGFPLVHIWARRLGVIMGRYLVNYVNSRLHSARIGRFPMFGISSNLAPFTYCSSRP